MQTSKLVENILIRLCFRAVSRGWLKFHIDIDLAAADTKILGSV